MRHNSDPEALNLTDSYGNTALMAAACKGRLQCCRELLAAGADPRRANLRGYTAVDAAVDAGHAECASMLFEAGAVPTLDSFGRMPDECAVPPVPRCLLADDE